MALFDYPPTDNPTATRGPTGYGIMGTLNPPQREAAERKAAERERLAQLQRIMDGEWRLYCTLESPESRH